MQMAGTNQNFNGYPELAAIGRDAALEVRIGLRGRAPSDQEWCALVEVLRRAAEFLAVSPVLPKRPDFVLADPLEKRQRAELDASYVPRYSAAFEQDELPRERMEIHECREKMVPLESGAKERGLKFQLSSRPFAASCGEWAGRGRIFWTRAAVAELFYRAIGAFNAVGLMPLIEDGFRPYDVQAGLFRRRVAAVREENPQLSEAEVLREARAKTACAPYRAAHMGGAAVDFTLRKLDGEPLDLGNPYPTGGASTVLTFPYVTWEQYCTRQMFSCISQMAGLFPYPGEDWHVSFGDGLWAIPQKTTSYRYGAIKDFSRVDGSVEPFDPEGLRRHFEY